MSILLSNEIMSAVTDELRIATKSVQIITAYCKESAIKQLSSHISTQVDEKRIMLRFRLDDIIKGSTDFSVLEYCRSQGWKVYIRFDLHAKTYIVDGKRGFIGSANATNSGLNLGPYGNMEMGILIDIDKTDLEKIEALYNDAIYIDNEIYSKLKCQYQKINVSESEKQYSWDNSIKELFKPKITTLFSHELPDKSSFEIGEYLPFLDIVYREEQTLFKDAFRWSNAYLWLMNILKENEGCMYFGAIAKKLHDALISDPKPYRTDVKELLANLLNIIQMLHMDEIVIDKPNYTQRIRLKEVC